MAFKLNLGSMVVKLMADTTQYVKALGTAQQLLDKTAKKARAVGRKLSLYVTTPLSIIGGVSLKAFADFDDAMTQSLAIMDNVGPELRKEMELVAKSISRRSITAPTDLAEAYYFLASAGLDVQQSMKALPAVEKFAVAGMFDLRDATTLLTNAQSALGLKTKDASTNLMNMVRVSDVLVRANKLADASVEQFSIALTTKSAAALRLMGKEVEEGVAVLAAFAEQGVKGQIAGEKLSIVLRDLQAAAIKQEAVWKRMNLQVFDTTGRMRPLADIIEDLTDRFSGMSDKQKKMAEQMLGFQARSFAAIKTLMGSSEMIRRFEADLKKAGGTTEKVANKQLKSFSSQMKIFKNNVTLAAMSIGESLAPKVTKLTEQIQKLLTKWESLDQGTKEWIVDIGIAAAAIGPLFLGLTMVLSAASSFVAVLSAVGLTATYVISVIAILSVGILLLVDHFTDGEVGILKFIGSFRIAGIKIGTWQGIIGSYIVDSWDWVASRAVQSWEEIKNAAVTAGGIMWRHQIRVANAIAKLFEWQLSGIQEAARAVGETLIGLQLQARQITEAQALAALLALDKVIGATKGINTLLLAASVATAAALAESLEQAEKQADNHFQKMLKLEDKYIANVKLNADVRQEMYDRDMAAFRKAELAEKKRLAAIKLELAMAPGQAAAAAAMASMKAMGMEGFAGERFEFDKEDKETQRYELTRMSGISMENIQELGDLEGRRDELQLAVELNKLTTEQLRVLNQLLYSGGLK